jgi:hypothetical protein
MLKPLHECSGRPRRRASLTVRERVFELFHR